MVISKGESVHIITRRKFDDDLRRHFAGVVEEASEGPIRVTGYAFVFDKVKGEFVRREGRRTRIFGIGAAGLIIIVLPSTVDIDDLRYKMNENGNRVITDSKGFTMNISEFGSSR